ncbi:excisionase family DNA-binding protein [Defluviimonas sp. WL0024]|uniref:Excisionase family DNA-binding protein n=1 Tax=Albidovulum salinarum TaxID=2984153 RepID=A0ABT2X9J2_9RHOB|nr:excisionase family DNA-binding protein [Defluviimonas sp. WL0024]MCU9850618.1 excisionase family DNA-binding protein [Defluviimonas sp. WL0024]
MKLSIGQAAKQTGKSKSTISRAIKTGRLSATRRGSAYEIDAAELFRVFDATDAQPGHQNDAQPTGTTPQQPHDDVEVRMLREMLERERETVEDLRERLTRAELMLTDQRQKRRRWWPF